MRKLRTNLGSGHRRGTTKPTAERASRLSLETLEKRELLTTFYVDGPGGEGPGGNDANNGLSIGSAFATIQRAANAASAGDTIEIRGGTYRETVSLPRSGTAAAPITFRSYEGQSGDAEEVIVSGADLVTGWTQHDGDIWRATVTWNAGGNAAGNTLFVNGELEQEGREYSSFTSRNSAEGDLLDINEWGQIPTGGLQTSSFTSSDAVGWGDDFWNGARVRFHSRDWVIEDRAITDYDSSSGRISFSALSQAPSQKQALGFYIYGTLDTVDQEGEWFKSGNTLYYHAAPGQDPNDLDIEFKRRGYAFNASSRDNVHIVGLTFRGTGILTNSSTDRNVYQGNTFYGHDRANIGRISLQGNDNVFRDNEVSQTWGGVLSVGGNRNSIVNNFLHDIGYTGTARVIGMTGQEHLVSHNTVRRFARSFLDGFPTRSEFAYNVFEDGGRLSWDTGVFDADGGNGDSSYSIYHHNVFRNTQARGIYNAFYGRNENAVIHHNLIYDFNSGGIDLPALSQGGLDFRQAYHNTVITSVSNAPAGNLEAQEATIARYNNNVQITLDKIAAVGVDVRGNHNYTPADFVDFAGGDFRLAPGSGAIDAGIVLPRINDGFAGAAPDAGAFESDRPAWVAGHDFVNEPNPAYAWEALPGTNLFTNGQFSGGIGDWSPTGSPTALDRNSWNLQRGNTSLTDTPRTRSVELTPGEAISRNFTGLRPNTTYTLGAASRLVNEVPLGSSYNGVSPGGSVASSSHRLVPYVTGIDAGEWVRYDNIDFGDAGQYDLLEIIHNRDARFDHTRPRADVSVQIRVDSPTGPVIGEFSDPFDGDTVERETWFIMRSEMLQAVSGLRSIYVSVSGTNAANLAIGSMRLMNTEPPADDRLTATITSAGASTVSSQFGHYDWQPGYQRVSFTTGPTATSANVRFVNNGRLNTYIDRMYLIEGETTRGGTARNVAAGGVALRSISPTTDAAADGVIDGTPGDSTSTGNHAGSWIQVDLLSTERLNNIRINAPASGPGRLSNFRVSVWDTDPRNGGAELWSQDYLTNGRSLGSNETLFINADELDLSGRIELGKVEGRYVRVQLLGLNNSGNNQLAIGELQVMSFDNGNLAQLDGIASQSSVADGLSAVRAIDDDPTSRSATRADATNSWWQTTFSGTFSIGEIELTNHSEDTNNELSNFTVSVWDDDPDAGGTRLWAKSYFETSGIGPGQTLRIDGSEISLNGPASVPGVPVRLSSVTGRVVRVQLNGTNNAGNGTLSLANVRIASSEESPSPGNLAAAGNATQSTNFYGLRDFADEANDGIVSPVSNFTTTANSSQPWWQVALQQTANIGQIVIYNREQVPERLGSFRVSVWNDDPESGGTELWGRNYSYSGGTPRYSTASIGPGGALLVDGSATDNGARLDEVDGARYVRVQLLGSNFLSLAEVQVWQDSYQVDLGALEYAYDFGPENVVAAGAQAVSPSIFGDVYFNGEVASVDRGSASGDAYNRDFLSGSTPATFNHRIANGRYRVSLNMSDPALDLDNLYVRGEGGTLVSDVDRPIGQNGVIEVEVEVTDGELNLEFGDSDTVNPRWAVNRLVLTRIPSGLPVFSPAGGLVDSGTEVSVSNPDPVGSVYVTTDGSDPRLPDGGLNPNAILLSNGSATETIDLEDFDASAGLPAGWTATTTASNRWQVTPGAGDNGTSGVRVTNLNTTSDVRLTSSPFPVEATSRRISFRNQFSTENTWDGGILEVAIGAGPFTELVSAGGSFVEGGYNSTVFSSTPAWSGDSQGFITTTFDLPAAAAGQSVRLRWRFLSDSSVSVGTGWVIDNLQQTRTVPSLPFVEVTGNTLLNARTKIGDSWSALASDNFLTELPLIGDYNTDGLVDAADYTVWRDTYGQEVPRFSGADGDGDGIIGLGDRAAWRDNYGAAATARSLVSSAATPPVSLPPVAAAVVSDPVQMVEPASASVSKGGVVVLPPVAFSNSVAERIDAAHAEEAAPVIAPAGDPTLLLLATNLAAEADPEEFSRVGLVAEDRAEGDRETALRPLFDGRI